MKSLEFRRILLLLFLVGTMGFIQAQSKKPWFGKRYINSLLNDTSAAWKPKFVAYPTLGFSPETSWELGLGNLLLYYAKKDTTNRLSEVSAFTFITLNRQWGIWLDHALYTDKNNWFMLGTFRFQSFPLLYWGNGPNTPAETQALVEARYVILKERGLRKLRESLYLGPIAEFISLSRVDFIPEDEGNPLDSIPLGGEGSTNLSIGGSFIFDDRHNVLNVRDGNFFELSFQHSSTIWGSDYDFSTVISDNRIFRPIRNGRDVFAAQAFAQFTSGDVPFNQLSLMGGERIMRGYYLGRHRDKHQVAAQVEYRFLPFKGLKRWGAVAFASTGTVFSRQNQFALRNFKVAGGGGVRFLLFPEKDIYLRGDAAFTKEGPGFYFFIGEAF